MNTPLDKKEELICKIKLLSASDVNMLKIFMAGMEAERIVKESNEKKITKYTTK